MKMFSVKKTLYVWVGAVLTSTQAASSKKMSASATTEGDVKTATSFFMNVVLSRYKISHFVRPLFPYTEILPAFKTDTWLIFGVYFPINFKGCHIRFYHIK